MKNSLNVDQDVFVPTKMQSIMLMPSIVKDAFEDIFSMEFLSSGNSFASKIGDKRGNVQHRLGGCISYEEHEELVSMSKKIIASL